MHSAVQCRAGQGRAEQSKAGQSEAGQSEAHLECMVVSAGSLVLLEELVQVVVQLMPPPLRPAAVPSLLCILLLCLCIAQLLWIESCLTVMDKGGTISCPDQ